jgi:hypothetical protein
MFLALGFIGWSLFLFTQKIKYGRFLGNERGGGSKPQVIQTPTTPAPSPSQSAEDIYRARLKYDPQVAALEMQLQQQYMPQQAALYQSLYKQYYPEMARQQQALQRELFPYQSQIVEQGAQRALQQLQTPEDALVAQMRQQAQQRLTSPQGYTPEEQAAINAIRQRETGRVSEQLRERSNLGGTLYGGRGEQLESRALQELAQGYTAQDIDRLRQQQQLAWQQAGQVPTLESALASQRQAMLTPYMQIMYPQIGVAQPSISPFQYTSAVPSADQLYSAIFQASQPNYLYQPGSPSPGWGLAGSLAGGIGAGWANKFFK